MELDQEDRERIAWANAKLHAINLDLTRQRIEALGKCSMVPGSVDRRFIVSLSGRRPETLSDDELRQLLLLTWKHRRHIPRGLAPAINPADPFAGPRTGSPLIEARHAH